jgi:uncharacterized membrane protein YfcA
MVDFYVILLSCVPLGALAGFAAGLFGIGGGAVIVPALYFLFSALGYDELYIMHMAVGTSLVTIIPTAMSSSLTHYRHGAIAMPWFLSLVVGIAIGAVIGGFLAVSISGEYLRRIFAVLLFVMAGIMLLNKSKLSQQPPEINLFINTIYGVFSGVVSALIGIGGATLNVPYMTKKGLSINKAIATASLLGLCVALPASFVFLFTNSPTRAEAIAPYSYGYIHLLAAVAIVSSSMICAKYGAKLTHRIDANKLKYAFAFFMACVAVKMLL